MRRKRKEYWHVTGDGRIIQTRGRIYQPPIDRKTADLGSTYLVLNCLNQEQAEQLYTESLQILDRRAS